MAVRRQCNRYKTEPSGRDFDDVLKRGKAFFRDQGAFMVTKYKDLFFADSLPIGFKIPGDARIFKKVGRLWKEVHDAEI